MPMTPRSLPVRAAVLLLPILLAADLRIRAQAPQDAASPQALAESGHWKRLRAVVEPLVRANPRDAESLCLLARATGALGDIEAAAKLAERAVAAAPGNPGYHVHLGLLTGQQVQGASIFRQVPLGLRFKREIEKALALDAKHVDAWLAMMEFRWNAPGAFGGSKDDARKAAQRVTEIDPVRGYLAEGRLAGRNRDRPRMEALYTKALAADPRSYAAQFALANFYVGDAGPRLDLAEQHARAALALAPDRVSAYAVLARVLATQRRLAELDALLADARRAVPDDLTPFLTAATSLTRAGEFARAENCARTYLTQEREGNAPTHGVARWRLAQALEKQGRLDEARAELQAARTLEPTHAEIARDLARLNAATRR
jgi:tetratricopeptide (TPR) repeat protein